MKNAPCTGTKKINRRACVYLIFVMPDSSCSRTWCCVCVCVSHQPHQSRLAYQSHQSHLAYQFQCGVMLLHGEFPCTPYIYTYERECVCNAYKLQLFGSLLTTPLQCGSYPYYGVRGSMIATRQAFAPGPDKLSLVVCIIRQTFSNGTRSQTSFHDPQDRP